MANTIQMLLPLLFLLLLPRHRPGVDAVRGQDEEGCGVCGQKFWDTEGAPAEEEGLRGEGGRDAEGGGHAEGGCEGGPSVQKSSRETV